MIGGFVGFVHFTLYWTGGCCVMLLTQCIN
uniref:Uncharacterized protein n=1 Tax=Rhizophora mucronata TaxID=61149 RepID=A0A2P2MN24_RHIMU